MTSDQMENARNFIKNRPHLIWYTTNFDGLSATSIAEAVFNYGTWEDFQEIKNVFGLKLLSEEFQNIIQKKRVNLRPQTINYFTNYFNKYAS